MLTRLKHKHIHIIKVSTDNNTLCVVRFINPYPFIGRYKPELTGVSRQGDVQFNYILGVSIKGETIMKKYVPMRFIGEAVQVYFHEQPMLEKIPGAPDGFIWREEDFVILNIISEWHDYRRRGRMGHNMRPTHAATAERRGSWGVGQDYYRVQTSNGRVFDLYYDRAPKSVDDRKGAWYLDKELSTQE